VRINVMQNHYGYWVFVRTNDAGEATGGSGGPFESREIAILNANELFPGDVVTADGVTIGSAKPPPLPKIDPVREAERGGYPAVGVPADVALESPMDPIADQRARRESVVTGT
jgi:hypothetical protein